MTLPLTNARWVIHAHGALLPYTLLLESDGSIESSGITTSQLSVARRTLTTSFLAELTGPGKGLDDVELAVHARLRPLLGHGAFAAANVHMVPARSLAVPLWPTMQVEPTSIAIGDASVGMVADGLCGAPYIALAHGRELTDCLLLTWSGDWGAFRTYLRTDFLQAGAGEFNEALRTHKARVTELLGPPGVLEAMHPGGCAN